MDTRMVLAADKRKILKPVVGLVAVDMVNKHSVGDRAVRQLPDDAMFARFASYSDITSLVNPSNAAPGRMAINRAVQPHSLSVHRTIRLTARARLGALRDGAEPWRIWVVERVAVATPAAVVDVAVATSVMGPFA